MWIYRSALSSESRRGFIATNLSQGADRKKRIRKDRLMKPKLQHFFLAAFAFTLPAWGQDAASTKTQGPLEWKDVDATMGRPALDQTNSNKK